MSDRFEAGANVVSDYCFATSLITDIDEPSSVKEAMSDPDWMQAMRSEMSSLHDNQTWELVPRPSGKNVVKSKWLFKIKRNADGSISRYKARLVAQGYSQEQVRSHVQPRFVRSSLLLTFMTLKSTRWM